MEGNPDLYGPFWIATTVVVILFLTGTISSYLAHTGKGHFAYDFKLLSGAAGLIYGYTLFIPLGLWATLKWFRSESANVLECWALYGYANLIWIPVALVSWSPLTGMLFTSIERASTDNHCSSQLCLCWRGIRIICDIFVQKPVRCIVCIFRLSHANNLFCFTVTPWLPQRMPRHRAFCSLSCWHCMLVWP